MPEKEISGLNDPNRDIVKLLINGREYTGWTAATITMAIDNCSDAFSLTAPFDPGDPVIMAAFKPMEYQGVKLLIGNDVVLTGTVDKVDPKVDAGSRTITVQGRSLTGPLVDCSIDGNLEFNGLTLADIARTLCKPFGVRVRSDYNTGKIAAASAKFGQGAYDFLSKVGGPHNMLLNSSYTGELVITDGKALAAKAPIATLVEGKKPLLSVAASFDSTARFSVYKISAQQDGSANVSGKVTDATIKKNRPRLIEQDDTGTDPSLAAAWERSKAFAASMSVSATIAGWRRPDGARWAERQIVTLKAPGAMIVRESRWLIAGVTHKLDSGGGCTTDLRLILPETYAGTVPKVLPWE